MPESLPGFVQFLDKFDTPVMRVFFDKVVDVPVVLCNGVLQVQFNHARPALSSTPGGLTLHSARRSNRARQLHFIRAERSSNGSCRSHSALEGSSLPSCFDPFFFLPRLATPALRLGVIGSWQRSESYLLLRRYGRRCGQPSSSSLARRACVHRSGCSAFYCMASLVFVPLKFGYWLSLKFASAPGLSGGRGEMAMAVASSARLAFLRGAVCACCMLRQTLLQSDGPLSSPPQPLGSVGDTPCEDTREDFGLSV